MLSRVLKPAILVVLGSQKRGKIVYLIGASKNLALPNRRHPDFKLFKGSSSKIEKRELAF